MLAEIIKSFRFTLCELAPWLLLGMLLSGVLHVALPRDFLRRHLRGRWGVVRAVLFGIPLPLCSCGVIPTGIGLQKDGASRGSAVGFLISTPQTGVDSILVCAAMLGWPFALFKVVVALVLGCLGGWLTDATHANDDVFETSTCKSQRSRPPVRELLPHAFELLQSIWIWLVIGLAISAALDAFLPSGEVIANYSDDPSGTVTASFVSLAISVPLYVCATSSVPIASSLVTSGFPVASALVFLIAGPATNISTLLAIGKNLGLRAAAIYLSTIVIGSIVCAALFSWLLTTNNVSHVHPHRDPAWWQQVLGFMMIALIVWCAIETLRQLLNRKSETYTEGERFQVIGMTCQNCADKLQKALTRLSDVDSASIRLSTDEAFVVGSSSREEIVAAIRECGFDTRTGEL